MPVSLKYRTILIHVPKTAGTSIEKVLGVYGRRDCLHGLSKNGPMQHWTAKDIIGLMGETLYRNFFSIAFVRNPWDRCVSEYAYLQKEGASIAKALSFTQFVQKLPVQRGSLPEHFYQHLRPQSEYLFNQEGKSLVDYIGAFENLDQCWNDIGREIHHRYGIHLPKQLPRTQVSQHDHYSKYYNRQTREWIARVYEDDIRIHHYQFENN